MSEQRDVTALPRDGRDSLLPFTHRKPDVVMITTADGDGPPQRQLSCGCWQTEIVGMDGEKRWIWTIIACEPHRGSVDWNRVAGRWWSE